jgi:hypothetical protein
LEPNGIYCTSRIYLSFHTESASSFLLALQYCMSLASPAMFPVTVTIFYSEMGGKLHNQIIFL